MAGGATATEQHRPAEPPAALPGTPVVAWWSGVAEGDQRVHRDGRPAPPPVPAGRVLRRAHQIHGATVIDVAEAQPPGLTPADGDALVTRIPEACLGVVAADCATIALGSPEGWIGAVHAGWRGLAAGVVAAAVGRLRARGASSLVAGLGPCIGPCCYAFGAEPLAELADRFGSEIRASTSEGDPALDLAAGVRAALGELDVPLLVDRSVCTGCAGGGFSHRVRADVARHALFVWRRSEV